MRPIISNANGILDGLSKYLDFKLCGFLHKTSSYVRDSDDILTLLKELKPSPDHIPFTSDVVSMYTNIDAGPMLEQFRKKLPMNALISRLLDCLEFIMENNYFRFGKTLFRQKKGTAMGTAVAVFAASYYLACCEMEVLPRYKKHIVLYKRFIDDVFGIWDLKDDPLSFQRFLKELSEVSNLGLTHEFGNEETVFLDLIISRTASRYITRTHEKALNLYLYISAKSAHPSHVLKGLIVGRVLKFKKQNTLKKDFERYCKLLFQRLMARGYKPLALRPIFDYAINRAAEVNVPDMQHPKEDQNRLFLKNVYNDFGPTPAEFREIFCFEDLAPVLQELGTEKIIRAYRKPANLGDLVAPTKFTE